MNARNRALTGLNDHVIARSSRKDVLGLATNATLRTSENTDRNATRRLTDMGFRIRQPASGHWVLTHTTALPELHFYTGAELERFAIHKAHEYARRQQKENRE